MSRTIRQTTWLASLGAGLEYYDFIIYGMMVSFLDPLFFAGSASSWISQIKAFGVFAAGYLARPFGGVLFGLLGDTFGRKQAFLSAMALMAAATFAIGILPVRTEAGALLLLACRVVQGFSFGAELPGAMTVVHEHANARQRALYSGFIISSVTVGSLAASLALTFLTLFFSSEQIFNGGWRLPFLFGALLALANTIIRKYLHETPEFLEWLSKNPARSSLKTPLSLLLHHYPARIFTGIGLTFFQSSLVIFWIYLPTYLTNVFSLSAGKVYFSMTCAIAWAILILPLAGKAADHLGRDKFFLLALLPFLLLSPFAFYLLETHRFSALLFFTLLYQTLLSCVTVSYFPLLSSFFPTQVRFTGIAFCYNCTYALLGMLPIAITFLVHRFNPGIAFFPLFLCALISLSSLFRAKRFLPE